ncbi:2-haloalkanoic acid dehalogenase [Phyllobacterium phragmitis]|uniref:2-haloalkanoic acid dehalogenase n=1 Tax=Phyllobacterium phragmitis TaxID=2670329 RepID=A0A2S9IZL9_9HYPH|nr:HAD family phosphatase [Phyllobacterium phragmitis]PRD45981.1 2-haloalkanoic acid dehalogenase [Phyllobacterium phragmitis]
MSQPVKHIVFDIGKVLIHYDPHLGYHDIIPDENERRWFFENICTHDWNVEQDRGRTWPEAEAVLIEVFPDRADHIRAFRKSWHKMVPHAYDDSVTILRRLIAGGHDVTMLTNFASDTLREAQARYPFLRESRGVTVSGDIGLLKPDKAIYDHHAKAFDLEPSATLFIDDTAANVEGAVAAGWQAVQFTGPETLKADLRQAGIEI